MVQPIPLPADVVEHFEGAGYTRVIVTAPPGPMELDMAPVEALKSPCPFDVVEGNGNHSNLHTHSFSMLCEFGAEELTTLQANLGRFWLVMRGGIGPFYLAVFEAE